MQIATILGARPQFIKAATISRAISEYNANHNEVIISEKIIHTGQHFDDNMSKVFFEQMKIPEPHCHLGINGGNHGRMTGRMLEMIEIELLADRPDIVLVYGDTNSTLAGALAAKKLTIPVAHVEAGLRSRNMKMPEEINRILTDRISDFLFCPTDAAVANLKAEGFDGLPAQVNKTGDVMFDAALYYRQLAQKPRYQALPEQDFVLCTLHRAENTDDQDKLTAILEALEKISAQFQVVFPMHPRTKKSIAGLSRDIFHPRLHVMEPVGYLEMMWLLDRCSLVMTDSGGLQKEAYFFGKPCMTLREETEWVELVNAGKNMLVGTNSKVIFDTVSSMFGRCFVPTDLYGNGRAAYQIVTDLLKCSNNT